MLRRIDLRRFWHLLRVVDAGADPVGGGQFGPREAFMFADGLGAPVRVLTNMHGRVVLFDYGAGADGLPDGQILHGLIGSRAWSDCVGVEFVVLVGEFGYFHRVAFLFGDGGLVISEEVLFN